MDKAFIYITPLINFVCFLILDLYLCLGEMLYYLLEVEPLASFSLRKTLLVYFNIVEKCDMIKLEVVQHLGAAILVATWWLNIKK